MPFELINAPETFQRLGQTFLGDLHLTCCVIYLDDIIAFSQRAERHLPRLNAVFDKLRTARLKLKPLKYTLFRKQIKYLSNVVRGEGVSTDPKNIQVIVKWPRPTIVNEVKSFLGF